MEWAKVTGHGGGQLFVTRFQAGLAGFEFAFLDEEMDGWGKHHPPLAGQRFFRQHFAIEVGYLTIPPQVQLQDDEIVAHVPVNLGFGEIGGMEFLAIGTPLLLPHDGEALTLGLRFGKVIGQLQEAIQKPGLFVQPIVGDDRRWRNPVCGLVCGLLRGRCGLGHRRVRFRHLIGIRPDEGTGQQHQAQHKNSRYHDLFAPVLLSLQLPQRITS